MNGAITNRVTESGILTLNLEDYFPKAEVVVFDMKDHLFMELILKEKDFREALKKTDWSVYDQKIVALTCSNDAIIPMWAYMLVASSLQPIAKEMIFGSKEAAANQVLLDNISKIDPSPFIDKRVIIKGCGDLPVGESAYVEMTRILRPVAKSIMYGEPCSTVPVFKKPASTA